MTDHPTTDNDCPKCGSDDRAKRRTYTNAESGVCMTCPDPWHDHPTTTDDRLARQFHDAYESLAAEYGYTTRPESAVPWEDVPENNRRLMVAVVDAVVGSRIRELEAENEHYFNATARQAARIRELEAALRLIVEIDEVVDVVPELNRVRRIAREAIR